jgi:NADH-quinone oxidoreductase subunit M
MSASSASMATVGLLAATVYALKFIQQTFHGPNTKESKIPDLAPRDMAMMAVMIASLVCLGLYPQPVLDLANPALGHLQRLVEQLAMLGR